MSECIWVLNSVLLLRKLLVLTSCLMYQRHFYIHCLLFKKYFPSTQMLVLFLGTLTYLEPQQLVLVIFYNGTLLFIKNKYIYIYKFLLTQ
jgi:hypothetical protein